MQWNPGWRLSFDRRVLADRSIAAAPIGVLRGGGLDLVVVAALQELNPIRFDQIDAAVFLCDAA